VGGLSSNLRWPHPSYTALHNAETLWHALDWWGDIEMRQVLDTTHSVAFILKIPNGIQMCVLDKWLNATLVNPMISLHLSPDCLSHMSVLWRSHDSSVSVETRLQARWLALIPGRGNDWIFSLHHTAFILALRPTQPPIQWIAGDFTLGVKRPGHEADLSPPSSAKVKSVWSYTSTPQ
jgi:hypothetical protein